MRRTCACRLLIAAKDFAHLKKLAKKIESPSFVKT
jgi:hypothetical protein